MIHAADRRTRLLGAKMKVCHDLKFDALTWEVETPGFMLWLKSETALWVKPGLVEHFLSIDTHRARVRTRRAIKIFRDLCLTSSRSFKIKGHAGFLILGVNFRLVSLSNCMGLSRTRLQMIHQTADISPTGHNRAIGGRSSLQNS